MEAVAENSITDTQAQIKFSPERYKRNFNKRLEKNEEEVKLGDKVYLCIERENDKGSIHKLSPIVDGP